MFCSGNTAVLHGDYPSTLSNSQEYLAIGDCAPPTYAEATHEAEMVQPPAYSLLEPRHVVTSSQHVQMAEPQPHNPAHLQTQQRQGEDSGHSSMPAQQPGVLTAPHNVNVPTSKPAGSNRNLPPEPVGKKEDTQTDRGRLDFTTSSQTAPSSGTMSVVKETSV